MPPDTPVPDRPLTLPLLVRGSFNNGGFITLCVVSLVLSGIGCYSALRERTLAPLLVFLPLAAAFALAAAVLGAVLRWRRRWLEVTLTGFVLSNIKRRSFADEQVVAVRQRTVTTSEGVVKRRLALTVAADGGEERIDCRYTIPPGEEDPLAPFAARLTDSLARRTDAALARGATLSGDGWRLDAAGLRRGRTLLPLTEITHAGFFDRHLCVWRGADERPALRLPEVGRNVHPLSALLSLHLERNLTQSGPAPLGRLLLERSNWGLAFGLSVLAVSWLMACSFVAFGGLITHAADACFAFAVTAALVGAAGAVTAWNGRHGRLCFHERGVAQSGPTGRRLLLYEQIGEIVWHKDTLLLFTPKPGLGLPAIRFRCVGTKLDDEMATMRDLAAEPLAREWQRRLPAGPMRWTSRLRFLPGGLEYTPAGLLGPGEPVCVPYQYTGYRVTTGKFQLFVGGSTRAEFEGRTDAPNFFVGLVLLGWVYREQHAARDQSAGQRMTNVAPAPGEESTSIRPR